MKENNKLQELAMELDDVKMAMYCKLLTLNDLRTTLDHLRDDFDNVDSTNIGSYVREFHRTVRMLQELMKYTMVDFEKDFTELDEVSKRFFESLVTQEKNLHSDCNQIKGTN